MNNLIDTLAGVQQLTPASDLETVMTHLAPSLAQYTELEFRSDNKRIDLITLNRDPSQIRTFFDLLKARGAFDLTLPEALARFAMGKVMGMKLPAAGATDGGEIYARGAMPLAECRLFIKRYGVEDSQLDQVEALAAALHKPHLHMLAVDVESPHFTVFFTQYLTEDYDDQALCDALAVLGIKDIEKVLELHQLLGVNRPKTLFLSWGIGQPRAKIDYADARVGLVAEALHLIGQGESVPVLAQWTEHLQQTKVNYTGIIATPDGVRDLRAYFTVHSSALGG